MYSIKNKIAIKVESITFADISLQEADLEEMIRNNMDMICDDEESLLVIGQQVKNEKNGRSDLTAIDNNGSLVLIEIKRDRRDIEARKEAFEFQAIRYAASYATIKSIEELVKLVYAPYIEKHKNEFNLGDLTSYELGLRNIDEFLKSNNAVEKFNEKQRIILAASDYDEQTISAVAWLNKNNVDLSCFKLTPYKKDSEIFITAEKILPLSKYDDYYLNLMNKSITVSATSRRTTRQSLPKINAMLQWGVVKPGDIIKAKDRADEAVLQKNGNVKVDGKEMSLQVWLKGIYGWSSVQTYGFSIHKESNKTLSEIRDDYMLKESAQVDNS